MAARFDEFFSRQIALGEEQKKLVKTNEVRFQLENVIENRQKSTFRGRKGNFEGQNRNLRVRIDYLKWSKVPNLAPGMNHRFVNFCE